MSSPLPEKALRLRQKGWRRRHPRHRTDLPLKATALREDGYAEIQGRCSDISQGGMGTILNGELPPGEVVSLEVRLPASEETLVVRAIVRFQSGFVHGFEFLGPSTEQQSTINHLCAGLEASQ